MKKLYCTPVKLAVCLYLLIFNINGAFAQSEVNLYISMPDLESKTKSLMQEDNISSVPVIYTKMIDPNGALKLDSQSFTSAINQYIPNANSVGNAVIDWESKLSVDLELQPQNSTAFQYAEAEFTKAITLAKKLRPNMKWGFFGVPWQPLEKRDTRRVNSDIPLLKLCDVFYPQLYVPYNTERNDGRRTKSEKDDWISHYLLGTLKIAKAMNKPVIAFIWHRYYGRDNSLKLMPLDEFTDYIKEIIALSYQRKKVDGLVMWGNDHYYYTIKSPALVSEFDSSGVSNYTDYHDELMRKYLQEAYKTVRSSH
jgi:hypothetical protein